MYFNNTFLPEFNVRPKPELENAPIQVRSDRLSKYSEQGKPLVGDDMDLFVLEMAAEIAQAYWI